MKDAKKKPPFTAFASVILDSALDKVLSYGIPENLLPFVSTGSQVEVPVKNSLRNGYVIGISHTCTISHVKPIASCPNTHPLIPEDLLKLAHWISKYYCCPLYAIFKMLLPPSVRRRMAHKEQLFVSRAKTREEIRSHIISLRSKKPAQSTILEAILPVSSGMLLTELLEITGGSRSTVHLLAKSGFLKVEPLIIDRSPLVDAEYFPTKAKTLNEDQECALLKIKKSLRAHSFETHLLFGVTGSGKTEVYLQAIEEALSLKKTALMLVPEISLTTQTIERFRSRFNEKIAILHHRLSDGERNDAWHSIHSGKAKIVIGARSAIFSPLKDLGLIIVDEEHEATYKQSDLSPCYQARDVAVMRGKITSCTVILGSATPSIESYFNAQTGKYILSTLHSRATASKLPKVTIVDMKKEFDKAKGWTHFSECLLSQIEKRLKLGEQSLLFLNRRGYHTVLKCPSCGESIKCPHCDIPLTFHLSNNSLSCHLCHFQSQPPPKECPKCKGSSPLKFQGAGTEQIEKALYAIFPSIRILRVDADTTKHKGSHEKLLKQFATGKADLLLGTQMIAKGLHFPEVTLVGVISGDSGLNIPDFRAAENTFQIITQVAGRSGRGVLPGEVIIQSTLPDHSVIGYAAKQDYPAFFAEEIAVRELFGYPPFKQLAKFVFSGQDNKLVEYHSNCFRNALIESLPKQFEFLPVVPCGYAKIKNLYRYQFLLKGPSMHPLSEAVFRVKQKISLPKEVKLSIDVNPSSTFF